MSDFFLSLSAKRACIILLFFTLFLFFTGLDQREPESGDETRVAGISMEMVVSGDYLVPHLNSTPFLEYPPMCYWAQCFCLKLIKNPLTALKIPSAVSALLAAFFIFFLSLKLRFSPWQALLSSGLLITGIQFFLYARCLMVDMMLSAFIAGSFFSAYALLSESVHHSRVSRFLYFLLFVFMLAGGVMTKGLFGLAVPLSGIGIWLIVRDVIDKRFRFYAYFVTGLAVLAAIIIPSLWYGAIYHYRGYQLFYEAFWVNNFGRFSGTQGDHVEGFFYYFSRLPGIFFPWLWFAFAGLVFCGLEIKCFRKSPVFYPVVIMLVPFLLLCVASSKRQVYLLPLYAPAAICAMYGLWRIITLLGNLKNASAFFQRFSPQKILLFITIILSLFPIVAFFITKNFILPFSALFLPFCSKLLSLLTPYRLCNQRLKSLLLLI